jgi:hypothetical protein
MAIQQGLTTSFKQQMLQGAQNLAANTLKIALYTANADLGPNTTTYTGTTNEVTGTGYTTGGETLTGVSISASSEGVVYVNFDNPAWTNASFTARGALIYNSTQSNSSVAVLDFGADKTCSNQTFTVTMPANTATTALIRFP